MKVDECKTNDFDWEYPLDVIYSKGPNSKMAKEYEDLMLDEIDMDDVKKAILDSMGDGDMFTPDTIVFNIDFDKLKENLENTIEEHPRVKMGAMIEIIKEHEPDVWNNYIGKWKDHYELV